MSLRTQDHSTSDDEQSGGTNGLGFSNLCAKRIPQAFTVWHPDLALAKLLLGG